MYQSRPGMPVSSAPCNQKLFECCGSDTSIHGAICLVAATFEGCVVNLVSGLLLTQECFSSGIVHTTQKLGHASLMCTSRAQLK